MIFCNKCGHQNSDDSSFCSECGNKLIPICPFCHTELTKSAKFCQKCGKRLAEHEESDKALDIVSKISNGSVIAGDIHATIIYNQEIKRDENQNSPLNSQTQSSASDNQSKSLPSDSEKATNSNSATSHAEEAELSAFEYCKLDNGKYAILGLKDKNAVSVVIPNCVESIEDGAFYGCKFIEVKLSDSLVKIGNDAFANCENLAAVVFPRNLLKIGDRAFANCKQLGKITWMLKKWSWGVSDGLKIKSIGEEAFKNCEKLDVYIPNGWNGISVGNNAFQGDFYDNHSKKGRRFLQKNHPKLYRLILALIILGLCIGFPLLLLLILWIGLAIAEAM